MLQAVRSTTAGCAARGVTTAPVCAAGAGVTTVASREQVIVQRADTNMCGRGRWAVRPAWRGEKKVELPSHGPSGRWHDRWLALCIIPGGGDLTRECDVYLKA